MRVHICGNVVFIKKNDSLLANLILTQIYRTHKISFSDESIHTGKNKQSLRLNNKRMCGFCVEFLKLLMEHGALLRIGYVII